MFKSQADTEERIILCPPFRRLPIGGRLVIHVSEKLTLFVKEFFYLLTTGGLISVGPKPFHNWGDAC